MRLETFFKIFDRLGDAPSSIEKLRQLVLDLAVNGRLVTPEAQWTRRPLKSVATKIGSGATPAGGRESYFCEGVPLIRSMNVYFSGFDPTGLVFLSDQQADGLSNVVVQADDVLLNITGASIGRVTTAPRKMAGARVNQHVTIIRPTSELTPRFLAIFLASPSVQQMIDDIQVGATRQALTKAMIEQFEIPLPPLAEQNRIVAKVDELMALCDRLALQQQERETRHTALARASLARFAEAPTPANLSFLFHPSYTVSPTDLRKSILSLAVEGKLISQGPKDQAAELLLSLLAKDKARLAEGQGIRPPRNIPPVTTEDHPYNVPNSWQWRRIGHLALVIDYGTSQKADSDSTKVPVYRMGNIARGRLSDVNLKYVDASIDDLPRLYLKTNDILFNRTNSYELVGKVGIYNGPDNTATFASYLIRIRLPDQHLFAPFYNLAMNAPYFRQTQIEPEVVQQCGQANFNGTKLAATVVPVPPFAEQRRIVAKVDQLMALVDQLEAQLTASRATATKLLDAIVAELTAA